MSDRVRRQRVSDPLWLVRWLMLGARPLSLIESVRLRLGLLRHGVDR